MQKILLSVFLLGFGSDVYASSITGEWECPDNGAQSQLKISADGTFSNTSTNSNIFPWSGTWKEGGSNVVTLAVSPSKTRDGIPIKGFTTDYRVKFSAGKLSLLTPAGASFENCARKPTESTPNKSPALRETYATDAKDAAVKQAKAAEEPELADAKLPEARRALFANISGPMLCMIDGKSKPTLYLDLDVNSEFKLVRNGTRPISGKWHGGAFQGQNAIILQTPASSGDSFPDLYTAYDASIKIAQSSISLTLARRSTFPGSRSAEAYEAVCVKAKSLTLDQAMQLTGANLKNNPLRPEAQAKRQEAEAHRPSAEYCTRLEDTYAHSPALQKQMLARMGCN